MSQSNIKPWYEVALKLSKVALGIIPPDLIIKNTNWVNVQSREVIPNTTITISEGRFAYCGPDNNHPIEDSTHFIDAEGQFIVPGLCDGHMHIESGMLTPARFTEVVAPHGTTSMFADPHEIANVLGMEGIRYMYLEAMNQAINIFLQIPSCVPSFPGFEDPGSELDISEISGLMNEPNIIGLGEMMDFIGVIQGQQKLYGEMALTRMLGKTVGGHYPSPDLGREFHSYVASGPADDHEGTREIDAISRSRQGMRAMLRLGSAWYDVKSQITAVTEKGLDPRNFILCTDDCDAGTLVNDGHMNRVVRHAIDCGCEPLVALQMATVNTATHFGLEREIGSISPGRRADFFLTTDLTTLPVKMVYSNGIKVAENGQFVGPQYHMNWPKKAKDTIKIKNKLTPDDFKIYPPKNKTAGSVHAHVIGVVENQAPTKLLKIKIDLVDGLVESDPKQDVCQVALVERHKKTGDVVNGLVSGFGYQGNMALASTVAHDSHHLIVVGTCRNCMAAAINQLIEVKGGITLFQDCEQKALVKLPIAGLISDCSAMEIANDLKQLRKAMVETGCTMNNAFMQHSLLALLVIPEFRISNKGLFDVTQTRFIELFEENH